MDDREPEERYKKVISTWGNNSRFDDFVKKIGEREVDPIIKEIVERDRPRDVLELGTGSGIETKYCLQSGCRVHGVDIQGESLSMIMNRLTDEEKDRLIFSNSSFEELELDSNTFDLAIGLNSFWFCNPKYFDDFFKVITDSLKSKGILVCDLLNIDDERIRSGKNFTAFSIENIKELFKSSYSTIEMRNTTRVAAEGMERHWNTFRIIAKKK